MITTSEFNRISKPVRDHIINRSLIELPDGLDNSTDLFEAGVIDSFGFVELVVVLEKEFHIKLEAEDIARENLKSIDAIVETVHKRLTEQSVA